MAETIQITKQEYSKLIATKGKYKALKLEHKSLESDYASLVSEHHKFETARREVNKLQVKVTMLETKLKNYSKLLEYTNYSRRRFRTQATKPNEYHIKNMYGTLELELQQQLHEMGEYQYDQSDDEVEVVEYNSEEDSEESEDGSTKLLSSREPESHTITLRDYTDKLSQIFSKSFNDKLKRVCNNENKTKTNLKERTLEMTVQRPSKNIIEVKIEYISSQSFREIEETQIFSYKPSSTLGLWLREL